MTDKRDLTHDTNETHLGQFSHAPMCQIAMLEKKLVTPQLSETEKMGHPQCNTLSFENEPTRNDK